MQIWPSWHLPLIVAGIFAVGQFIEGNILSPRLVGGSVGLHPVWLMFALFAAGSLFGFVGLLVAVPVAAAIAVLVRFALGQYLVSPLYTGEGQAGGAAEAVIVIERRALRMNPTRQLPLDLEPQTGPWPRGLPGLARRTRRPMR